MKGSVGFSASNSWISKAIMWFRRSKVSHTFIIINDSNHLLTLEAGKREVLITAFSPRYKNDYVELYQPLVDEDEIDRALYTLYPYIEKQYGYLQILGFALVSLLQRFGLNIKNPFRQGIICSELVFKYLILLGFEELKHFDPDTVAPDDLAKILREHDKFARVEPSFTNETNNI